MTDTRTFRIFTPIKSDADAFPLVTIDLAAPARVLEDDVVAVPTAFSRHAAETWAAELTRDLVGHTWGVRALDDAAPYSHWLRLQTEDGPADFVVAAELLPLDRASAMAAGYEYAELEVTSAPADFGDAGGKVQ
jgi:hypothetical protein